MIDLLKYLLVGFTMTMIWVFVADVANDLNGFADFLKVSIITTPIFSIIAYVVRTYGGEMIAHFVEDDFWMKVFIVLIILAIVGMIIK